MPSELDIVIPVYNEGRNIVATLAGLAHGVTTPARVLICYDHADDDTLPAIKEQSTGPFRSARRLRTQSPDAAPTAR